MAIENMTSFVGKKVIIYSATGFFREGIIKDVGERNVIMETEAGKEALLNKKNIFMIEEK